MSRSQFASAHPQPPPVVTVNSGGGNFSAGGTLWIGIQARCRGGWTLISSLIEAVHSAGDSITVQIPTSARADGDDIRRWEIVGASSNSSIATKSLAWIEGFELDEITKVGLPANLVLSLDAHVALGASVASEGFLPTGPNLLHGMVRYVDSLASFFRYNIRSTADANGTTVLSAGTGRWEEVGNDSTYIPSRTGTPGGCDRDVRIIPASDVLFPQYPADGSTGLPIKLLWFHDEGTSSPLPQGTRFGLSVLVGGVNKTSLFRDLLRLRFRGFVDLATGALDTSDGAGGTMDGVDEEVGFRPQKTSLLLQKDLPQGQGYLLEVSPQFSLFQLRGEIGINSPIITFLFPFLQAGNYSEAGLFLGDLVYATDDRLVTVPGPGLSVNVLSGGAIVDSFSFLDNPVTAVSGLASNTAGQQITLNGDGAVFLQSGAIPDSEALRALVSTESGQGSVSGVSSTGAVSGSSGSLSVTVGYPSDADGVGTIRADYPDAQVAGKSTADVYFNPLTIYLFVENTTLGEIRQFTQSVIVGASQLFSLTDWNSAPIVASVPSAADPTQGLFVPDVPTLATSGTGGNFPAGTYRVYAAFFWNGNQVSRISHAFPAMEVLEGSIAELLNSSLPFSSLSSSFVQPAFNGSVTASVVDNRVFAVGGQAIINAPGSNEYQGVYEVDAKSGTTGLNLIRRSPDGPSAGETIPTNSFVFPSGIQGADGATPIATTTADFPQPAEGATVSVSVDSTAGLATGLLLFTSTGGGNTYQVNSITNFTTVVLSNLTGYGNADSGATISSGAILVPTGALGPTGPQGAIGPAGADGSNGSDGVDGVDGRTVLSGSGAPAPGLGDDGDFYIDTAANELYGPRAAGAWGSGISLIGPAGADGSNGSDGVDGVSGFGIDYAFDSATAAGPPSGEIRWNNASPGAASELYVHETDANSASVSAILDLILSGAAAQIIKANDSSVFAAFTVNSIADNGTDRTYGVTAISNNGIFNDGDAVRFTFALKGDTGTAGAGGQITRAVTIVGDEFRFDGLELTEGTLLLPGIQYTFDQSDASNSANQVRFSETQDGDNASGTEYTAGIIVSGTPGVDGTVTFTPPIDAPQKLYPYVSGSPSVGGDSFFLLNSQGGGGAAPGWNGTWLASVQGTYTAAQQNAVNTFISDLMTANLWPSLDRVYLLAVASISIDDALLDMTQGIRASVAPTAETGGIKINSLENWIDLNINPNIDAVTYSTTNAVAAFYVVSNGANSVAFDIGDPATDRISCYCSASGFAGASFNEAGAQNRAYNVNFVSQPPVDATGFSFTRQGTTTKVYRDATLINTESDAGTVLPESIVLGGFDGTNSNDGVRDRIYGLVLIGGGNWSDSDITNTLSPAIDALMAAF